MGRRRIAAVSLLVLVLLVGAAVEVRGHDGVKPRAHVGVALGSDSVKAASQQRKPATAGSPAEPESAPQPARAADRAIDGVLRRRAIVRMGSRRRREIALTFDDGPSAYTKAVLRILRRAHARATFFPIGYSLDRWPGALAAERHAGDEVGDHTLDHPDLSSLGFRDQLGEVRGAALRLRRHGLPPARLLRPPYGRYDRRTLAIAHRLRMLVVLWSVDSHDYMRPGRRAIVRNVLAGARPGAIILMHDGGGRRDQTLAALPVVIRRLHRRGFRLVTVPELLRRSRTSR